MSAKLPAVFKHPLRVLLRALWLAGEILLVAMRYLIECPPWSKTATVAAKARWLQRSCRRILRIFIAEVEQCGELPAGGLLVSNHLSYLDILVLSSLRPVVFVAKQDVKSWPVLGWFATMAGTIFIDRERRIHVRQITRAIEETMNSGVLVVLFPEGTSSGGETVLPFKSSLLEPAVQQTHPLSAALIQYELDDGDASEEVCYWKDMTLLPHLINLLGKPSVRVRLRCVRIDRPADDRKELARQLHSVVLRLKERDTGARTACPRMPVGGIKRP
jgi:1-acyl-sn-glycerol-3-phosphate acyltransferase